MQLLAHASPVVLTAVSDQSSNPISLQVLAGSALNQADRTTIRSLLTVCKSSNLEYARGVATGLLTAKKGSDVRLVVSSTYKTEERQTAGIIAELISGSTHSLQLCSYVLVYLDELIPLFRSARERGVNVRILLDYAAWNKDSVATTVSALRPIIGANSLKFWAAEPGEEASLHAKFVIADGERALVTSANLTGRAITRNIEVGCLISDAEIIQRLTSFYETIWEYSVD